MEFEVLEGAQRLIQRESPVVYAENSAENKYEGMNFEDFMSKRFGYVCSRLSELSSHNIVVCSENATTSH
jgi:hypothetical protein